MVQRRTVPSTLAAALTAADLLMEVGARTVELLAHRTGAPEPPRLPAWPVLPGYRHRLLTGRGRRRQVSGVADAYTVVNQQSDKCVHVNGASVLQWTYKSTSHAGRLNQTWRLWGR